MSAPERGGRRRFTNVDYGLSSAWAGLPGARLAGNFAPNMAEVGAGFVAQFTPTIGFWGVIDYTTDIDGGHESREVWRANAGLRVAW